MEEVKQIDFVKIVKVIFHNKRYYFYALPIAFVLSSLYIICFPRYYRSYVTMAPEVSVMGGGTLSDMAASFGINIGSSSSAGSDAILPDLYPDVVASTAFQVKLAGVKIKTSDGAIQTTYYDYLKKYQKAPWWSSVIGAVTSLFSAKDTVGDNEKLNPFMMSRSQSDLLDRIGKNIDCSMDKKNYVISIGVEDQDPLVCATMADSVKAHLQEFITEYRTSKARNDYNHARKLCEEAHDQYVKARQKYAAYSDANEDLVLESYRSKQEDLENEIQLKYNTYTAMAAQMQAADAKVQERTPAFTTIQQASVPIRPAGPKRMIFVAVVLVLTFIGTSIYILYKDNKTEAKAE